MQFNITSVLNQWTIFLQREREFDRYSVKNWAQQRLQCIFARTAQRLFQIWVLREIFQRKRKKNRFGSEIDVNTCFNGEISNWQVACRVVGSSYGANLLGGGLCC